MKEIEIALTGYAEERITLVKILNNIDYYHSNQADKQIKDLKDRITEIDKIIHELIATVS